jgi:hypothetical protein
MEDLLNIIPEKWRPTAALAVFVVIPYLTRTASALMNGKGIVGAWKALLFGTNVPKELETRVTTLEKNTDTITKP